MDETLQKNMLSSLFVRYCTEVGLSLLHFIPFTIFVKGRLIVFTNREIRNRTCLLGNLLSNSNYVHTTSLELTRHCTNIYLLSLPSLSDYFKMTAEWKKAHERLLDIIVLNTVEPPWSQDYPFSQADLREGDLEKGKRGAGLGTILDKRQGSLREHRGKTQCAWAQNLVSGQLFISGVVCKPIA